MVSRVQGRDEWQGLWVNERALSPCGVNFALVQPVLIYRHPVVGEARMLYVYLKTGECLSIEAAVKAEFEGTYLVCMDEQDNILFRVPRANVSNFSERDLRGFLQGAGNLVDCISITGK
jgi:hypothetical protein